MIKKYQRKRLMSIVSSMIIFFSALFHPGWMIQTNANDENEKPSELQIEKEREQMALNEESVSEKSSDELASLLSGIGFEPALQDSKPPKKANSPPKVDEKITQQLDENKPVDVIIQLKKQENFHALYKESKGKTRAERAKLVKEALESRAKASQKGIKQALEALEKQGNAKVKKKLWINNSIVATVDQKALEELQQRDDIKEIRLDEVVKLPDITVEDADPRLPEWGLEKIKAPQVWGEYGMKGEGIVVGIMDTGVDGEHEALRHNYRGRDGEHQYSWIDLSGHGYETPTDGNGHGTHVAGTAVGGGEGEPIGVAPEAEWIAAKIFNDSGSTTLSAIHEAFQWFIAPGGDPSKAPHVVNNSWGNSNTYNLEFYEDVQAWISAGIFPLFAAGNDGPGSQTIGSPASLIESFAVGATDRYDQVASFSSRGPVYWEDENGDMVRHIKPDIAAPGHEIYSAWPTRLDQGNYRTISGTSMATPHVAGSIALLLSANPDLTIDEIAELLKRTARTEDHMGEMPNSLYGSGIVNVYQAVTEAAFAGELRGSLVNEAGEPVSGQIVIDELDVVIEAGNDGNFSYAIREGTYDVVVQSFGYEDWQTTISIEKDEVTEVSWQLQKAESYTVSGTVTDSENGEGIPYAFIRVKDTPLQTFRTNSYGEFEITGLPAGTYEWHISGEGIDGTTETIQVKDHLDVNIQVEKISVEGNRSWPTVNHSYQRNALSPNSIDVEHLENSWSYQTESKGQLLFSSPAVDGQMAVFTTDRGWVVAVNVQTGEERWSIRLGSTNRSSPTIHDGTVYLSGGGDQHIYALDLNTGRTIWSTDIGQPAIYESPVVRDGKVYVASGIEENASIHALHAETGDLIWTTELGASSFSGPAAGDEHLYVGTYDNQTLRAIQPEDGSVVWEYQPEENEGFSSHPVYHNGIVYILSTNFNTETGTLHAVQASDGKRLWKTAGIGDSQAASPVIYGDMIIAGSASQPLLRAFDLVTGEERWSSQAVGTVLNNGAVSSNGILFIANTNGSFFAVDVYSGDVLYEETLPNYSSSSPVILPGMVLVPHLDGLEGYTAPGILTGTVSDESGEPLEAMLTVEETGQTVKASEDGSFTLLQTPGIFNVNVSRYGYKQVTEEVTFVSGYGEERHYTLPAAETGSLSIQVKAEKHDQPLDNVSVKLMDTPIEGTTDQNGTFVSPSVYEGTYEVSLELSGFQPFTERITVEKETENTFTFYLKSYHVAVLNDYESEITEFLSLNGYAAEERDWDIIEDIGRYEIVYVNGAYSTDGWKPDEEIFQELVNAANEEQVSLIFADTWGSSYGSIHHLVDYFEDPQEVMHDYSSGTVLMRVDEEHPIFSGYQKGDYLTLIGRSGDFAWFSQYSGRELASIGSSELGFVGTGVAYKPVTENSAHLLLSAHAASPWTSPFQGWMQDAQNILLNSIDYLLNAEFGKVTGTVKNEENETLDATIEVADTGYVFKNQGTIHFYHDEGTYTLTIRAPGYETETVEVEVAHGSPVELDMTLTSTNGGSMIGTVTDALTDQPLADATVTLHQGDEIVEEVVTGEHGRYEMLDLDEGNYELRAVKDGYIQESFDVEIRSVPNEQNIQLTPIPDIAVLDDYYADERNFASVFREAGMAVEDVSSYDVLDRLDEFDVLFINGLGYGLRDNVAELFERADEARTSLVFGETLYSSSPLNQLVEFRGDPSSRHTADHNSSAGYVVTEEHPIFADAAEGEFIEILVPSNSRIGYFEGYSGYSLASMKHRDGEEAYGPGLAYKPRTESSMEVLLGGYGFTFSHHADHYTEKGKQLLIDTVVWAAHKEFPVIEGTVTDPEGNPLDATIEVVGESYHTTTDEQGQFSIALPEGDYEINVESFGYESVTLPAAARFNGGPLAIQMEVHPDAGSIQGIVQNEQDGNAISDVEIELEGHSRGTSTNTQGAFQMDRIEPGEYTLMFSKDEYVMKKVDIELEPGQQLELTVDMKPSPLVGIIVDNQSNDATLADYLEERGYRTTDLFYTDVDRLKDLDLVIVNADYNRDLEPNEEEFSAFLKAIDEEKLSVIWTGHVNGRGGIRFLHEFEHNPAFERQGTRGDIVIQAGQDHPITAGINQDETYPLKNRLDYYYAFDEYDGQTVVTLEHPEEGHIGDMVAYKGRTSESVEVLLANMTFGYYYNPDAPDYFDSVRERLLNNAILWALDHEEPLAADLYGTITNHLGHPVQGSVTVAETGKQMESDGNGEFYLGLQEGTYTLQIEAFGHDSREFTVTVENGEVYHETFELPSHELGLLTGTVLDGQTEQPVEGATVSVVGTPLTAETDESGHFQLSVPAGAYDLQAKASGYTSQILSDVTIHHDEETNVTFYMEESEKIAVVTQSYNQYRFESILNEYGYEADFIDGTELEELTGQLEEYALVIYNHSSYQVTDEVFEQFVEQADQQEVSIIFASQYGGGTIKDLRDVYGNPESVTSGYVPGHINIQVLQDHPLFEGIPGDEFRVLDKGSSNQQYAVYDGYSGTTIGAISHDEQGVLGDGIGYEFRTANSVHLLLSGFQIGSYSDPETNWTAEAKRFYNNAINWAIHASLGEIRGVITDEEGNPVANATVSIPGADVETVTNARGEYRIGIGSGTYEVHVQARGYHETTQTVTIKTEGDTAELNFTLTVIEGTSMTGTVTDQETDEVISGATVSLYVKGEEEPMDTVETDASGTFSFEKLLPDEYVLEVAADGYMNSRKETVVEEEPVSIHIGLNQIKVAVIGDHNNQIVNLLNEHELYAEERNWDVTQEATNYELIVINANDGTEDEVNEILEVTDKNEMSVVFLGTWGVNEGSIPLLERATGYPSLDEHGYNEGEVIIEVQHSNHPIFEGLPDSFVIHGEKSPYSTFTDYPGPGLAELSVDGEKKGTAISYEFRSQSSIHLLLSSFAVNNMIAPDYGWTDEAKTLFVQALNFAMNAEQSEPDVPIWDESRIRTDEKTVTLTGKADPFTTVHVYETKGNESIFLGSVTSNAQGVFEFTSEFENGNHFLYAEAENFAGVSEWSDRLQLIITGQKKE